MDRNDTVLCEVIYVDPEAQEEISIFKRFSRTALEKFYEYINLSHEDKREGIRKKGFRSPLTLRSIDTNYIKEIIVYRETERIPGRLTYSNMQTLKGNRGSSKAIVY
jgi:hypothetical protein